MNAFFSWIRRVWQTRSAKALVPVIAGSLAVVVLFAAFGAAPAAAQGTTPPTCAQQVSGTRFTLPTMVVMIYAMWQLLAGLERITGLRGDDLFHAHEKHPKPGA